MFVFHQGCLLRPCEPQLHSAFCPALSAIKALADPCPLSGKTGPAVKQTQVSLEKIVQGTAHSPRRAGNPAAPNGAKMHCLSRYQNLNIRASPSTLLRMVSEVLSLPKGEVEPLCIFSWIFCVAKHYFGS